MKLLKAKEKKERALGTRLGLKAYRSSSPKSAMNRRPYRPGEHGKRMSRSNSEFKQQLMEKQKMKLSYGLTERQMRKVFETALSTKKSILESIVSQLESRLDNVAYRMGFAPSRIVARQFVGHGHITVNGRKVTVPSFVVRAGDIVSIRENSRPKGMFKDVKNALKGHADAAWFIVDPEKLEGKVKSAPEGVELPFNINLVTDYYSR
jgi:small subunit ribosomal protein S4